MGIKIKDRWEAAKFIRQTLWFWIVAFFVLVKHTLRGNNWHMIYVDFEAGKDAEGKVKRERLIAMKRLGQLVVERQKLWESNQAEGDSL